MLSILKAPRHIRSVLEPFGSLDGLVQIRAFGPQHKRKTRPIDHAERRVGTAAFPDTIRCLFAPYGHGGDGEFDKCRREVELESLARR
jgi:hypothetical protein